MRSWAKLRTKPTREIPWLCRRGSNSSTFQGVHQRNFQARGAKHTKGSFAMGEVESVAGGWWGMWRAFSDAKSSQVRRSSEIWWDPVEAVGWGLSALELTGRDSGPSSRFERLIG